MLIFLIKKLLNLLLTLSSKGNNMLKKFINEKEDTKEHWLNCEKNRLPYIAIKSFSNEYSIIYYDITNLNVDLEKISESLRRIYLAYIEFLQLNGSVFYNYVDQYYYLNFLVKAEHAEVLAEYLFDYLKG